MRSAILFGCIAMFIQLAAAPVHGASADVRGSGSDTSRIAWIDCLSQHVLASRSEGAATSFAAARNRARAACSGHLGAWRRFLAEQYVRVPAATVDAFVDQVLLRVWQVQL